MAGAVSDSTTTPTPITRKPAAAAASTPGSSTKYSPNSQTLKAMLTIGSTITISGCETRSGPFCRAVCSITTPAAPPTATA